MLDPFTPLILFDFSLTAGSFGCASLVNGGGELNIAALVGSG